MVRDSNLNPLEDVAFETGEGTIGVEASEAELESTDDTTDEVAALLLLRSWSLE